LMARTNHPPASARSRTEERKMPYVGKPGGDHLRLRVLWDKDSVGPQSGSVLTGSCGLEEYDGWNLIPVGCNLRG
jgi:hypothetical protein